MQIKGNLLDLAKERDLTVIQMADILEMSRHTIYQLNHRETASLGTLLKISYLLNCKVENIIELEEKTKENIDSNLLNHYVSSNEKTEEKW